jgi:hypothetical protein
MVMRKCVITIMPDNETSVDVQTGAVSTLEILDQLETIRTHFSKVLVREYKELTGDLDVEETKFQEWINFLRDAKI